MKNLNHKEHEEHKGFSLCLCASVVCLNERSAVGRMQPSGIRRASYYQCQSMKTLTTQTQRHRVFWFLTLWPLCLSGEQTNEVDFGHEETRTTKSTKHTKGFFFPLCLCASVVCVNERSAVGRMQLSRIRRASNYQCQSMKTLTTQTQRHRVFFSLLCALRAFVVNKRTKATSIMNTLKPQRAQNTQRIFLFSVPLRLCGFS